MQGGGGMKNCSMCMLWQGGKHKDAGFVCVCHDDMPCCAMEMLRYLAYNCTDPQAVMAEYRQMAERAADQSDRE